MQNDRVEERKRERERERDRDRDRHTEVKSLIQACLREIVIGFLQILNGGLWTLIRTSQPASGRRHAFGV